MRRWEEDAGERLLHLSASLSGQTPGGAIRVGSHGQAVRHNGEIKWRGQLLYLSEVLAKEPVGLNRSTSNGKCVTVFIYSGYSMKETKTLPQLKAGMELSAQKCKRCPRSKT